MELELLRRYATSGDAEAFHQIVVLHRNMVHATSRRILGNDADADDVVQEAFLRLAMHADAVTSNVGAWLHRCAHNLAIDLAQKRRRDQHRDALHGGMLHPTPAEADRELQSSLDACLLELEEPQRALVVDHYLCGISQGDLADRYGVGQSQISRRLQSAVAQLRVGLGRRGYPVSVTVLAAMLVSPQAPGGETVEKIVDRVGAARPRLRSQASSLIHRVAIMAAVIGLLAAGWWWRATPAPVVAQTQVSSAVFGNDFHTDAAGVRILQRIANEVTAPAPGVEVVTVKPVPGIVRDGCLELATAGTLGLVVGSDRDYDVPRLGCRFRMRLLPSTEHQQPQWYLGALPRPAGIDPALAPEHVDEANDPYPRKLFALGQDWHQVDIEWSREGGATLVTATIAGYRYRRRYPWHHAQPIWAMVAGGTYLVDDLQIVVLGPNDPWPPLPAVNF